VSANLPQPAEPPAPGILAQAQSAAQSAVGTVSAAATTVAGTVTGALGGGHKEVGSAGDVVGEVADGLKGQKNDGLVDKLEDRHVEEFLRAQVDSSSKKAGDE
jgi:hypothetical protein